VAAVRRVLDRVVDQVREHLAKLAGVGGDGGQRLRRVQHEVDVLRQVCRRRVDLELRDLEGVALLDVHPELAGVELAREQEVVHDLRQAVRFLHDDLEELVAQLCLQLDVAAA